ncbi:MAG: HIT domain-containing protein [candidate division NC10 bacterium]|nr:HIT domain-containing protein [candidate division NC10 bacterium]MCZ6550214.1 HIT domain-containing protein [candidate division NC10 bacterium]
MTVTLWAPWRMQYIVGPKSNGCILCEKAKGDEDTKNLILARGPLTYVLMNIYPYNSGHLMIAPYRHLKSLEKLSPDETAEMIAWASKSERILREAFHAEGFNIGVNVGKVAGAGIDDHLHMHVVPRWNGDTNFMPVLGETKVIPEYLEETYAKLLPYYQAA